MADITNFPIQTKTVGALPAATLPLTGAELVPVEQGGVLSNAPLSEISPPPPPFPTIPSELMDPTGAVSEAISFSTAYFSGSGYLTIKNVAGGSIVFLQFTITKNSNTPPIPSSVNIKTIANAGYNNPNFAIRYPMVRYQSVNTEPAYAWPDVEFATTGKVIRVNIPYTTPAPLQFQFAQLCFIPVGLSAFIPP